MNKKQFFGTDGIRGKVGSAPITADFMLQLGWALGRVFAHEDKRLVLIGKDTRISGYMFEAALQAGLSAAGMHVGLLGPMPTPGIAYLTRKLAANVGIVISASHNPYFDNGIKLFNQQGEKLSDDLEHAIEAQLAQAFTTATSANLGKSYRVQNALAQFRQFCQSTFFADSLKGLKIVLDCAHGATYQVGPQVFTDLGADVISLGVMPDGLNINQDCGSTKPATLQQRVVQEQADLGIAFDGDGDRVIMVDAQGKLIDGDAILYILAHYHQTHGSLQGGVIGTLMSNFGLEQSLQALNIPFARAGVGDRFVLASLKENNWQLGGEPSGHIICLDKTTTGDGIIAALQVLSVMVKTEKSLADLTQDMQVCPQVLVNVRLEDSYINPLAQPEVKSAVQAAEQQLQGKGRVLLRPSGTEPLLRVMVEGEDGVLVKNIAEDLADVVAQSVS